MILSAPLNLTTISITLKDKIILILSGGMDSFTLLHYALDQGYHVDCITFDYGQRHIKEIECARLICKENNLTNSAD